MVERAVPVLPYGFDAALLECLCHLLHGTVIADGELFECLRVGVVASGVHTTGCRHGGDTKGAHIVAYKLRLAGGVRDIDVVVKDTHGECHLCQFAVGDEAVRLESLILSGAHTWEIDAILRAPIVLLQVAQVVGHHRHVGLPLLLQSQERSHTDGVNAGHAHAVKAVDTPIELRLHAGRVVVLIVRFVIGLLKANHPVQAVVSQHLIVLCGEWHHLYLQVREVWLSPVQSLCEILRSGLGRVLTRHDEQVLKRSELLYRLVFILTLVNGEDGACHRVLPVEAAIDAAVGAGVGDIERYEHRHCLAKTLLRIFL